MNPSFEDGPQDPNTAPASQPSHDPFLAPEVPPRSYLRQLLLGEVEPTPDLADQLDESPNVQRALQLLRLEEIFEDEPSPAPPEISARLVEQLRRPPSVVRIPAASEPTYDTFQVGDICSQTHEVAHFYAPGRLGKRYLWRTCFVLLVEEVTSLYPDLLFRAIPCTPADLWPEWLRCTDEIVVSDEKGEQWVAHLWLEYPIVESQLHRVAGKLSEQDEETVAVARLAYAEGLPLGADEHAGENDPESPLPPLQEARAELFQQARWISASADAWLSWIQQMRVVARLQAPTRVVEVVHEALLEHQAARDYGNVTFCGAIVRTDDYLEQETGRFENTPTFQAKIKSGPDLPVNEHLPWDVEFLLTDLPETLRGGETFLLYRSDTREILGKGMLNEGTKQYVRLLEGRADFPPNHHDLIIVILI